MTVAPGYSIQTDTLGEFNSEVNRTWVDTFSKALRAAGIPERLAIKFNPRCDGSEKVVIELATTNGNSVPPSANSTIP